MTINLDVISEINTILSKKKILEILALSELDRLSSKEQLALISITLTTLRAISSLIRKIIIFHRLMSVQLLDGNIRKSGLIARAAATKAFLYSFSKWCISSSLVPEYVLIEDQTINNLSGEVMSQITMYYCKPSVTFAFHPQSQETPPISPEESYPEIRIMNPRLKNTISFNGSALSLDVFYGKYSNLYSANKAHSKANFLHFMATIRPNSIDWEEYTSSGKNGKIASSRKKDIADAFMQGIAFLRSLII
jgi:hypothetical protein